MKQRESYRITAVRVVEFHNLGTTTIEIPDGGGTPSLPDAATAA